MCQLTSTEYKIKFLFFIKNSFSKTVSLCLIALCLVCVSCEDKQENTKHKKLLINSTEPNIGELHNIGLDILYNSIISLNEAKDTVFLHYTEAFAKQVEFLTSLYDGVPHQIEEVVDILLSMDNSEKVTKYISDLELRQYSGIVTEASQKIREKINNLILDSVFSNINNAEQIDIFSEEVNKTIKPYIRESKDETEFLALISIRDVAINSFIYWSNPKNMETWENIIEYAPKKGKDKNIDKDKGKDSDKDRDKDNDKKTEKGKIKDFVLADMTGASCGSIFGPWGSVALGSIASGLEALSWD